MALTVLRDDVSRLVCAEYEGVLILGNLNKNTLHVSATKLVLQYKVSATKLKLALQYNVCTTSSNMMLSVTPIQPR